MGIGKTINIKSLKQIAGGSNVVQVEDFDKLKETIEEIKSKSCTGKVTCKTRKYIFFLMKINGFELANFSKDEKFFLTHDLRDFIHRDYNETLLYIFLNITSGYFSWMIKLLLLVNVLFSNVCCRNNHRK